jgi:tetratricopeptide (TPR) repeat protein/tRNA A-37 threonylcarbamoyl transferase component Bud32
MWSLAMTDPTLSQPASPDYNLLFGVLALQTGLIRRDALAAAMNARVQDKTQPLGQVLLRQNALRADEHTLLEALVAKHLERHGNDVQKSLASVSLTSSLAEELRQIVDPDMQATLATRATTGGNLGGAADSGTPSPPAPDQRFRIVRTHAKGGIGEVFVAHDHELKREVAVKKMQDRHADHPESRARFLREAEITGGLEHPGIVPVYGLGSYANGRPYYAMRFIRGDSLQEAVQLFHHADGPGRDPGERMLALRQLLRRFVDVCNALAYAHSRGVLHRDLKPGNIMLGKYGETLVVDWGLAKALGQPEESSGGGERSLGTSGTQRSSMTVMGSAVGTPAFMSPEQAAGRLDELGPASDVYSLGATLYCLLTGKPPLEDRDVGAVLQRVQRGDFPRPRQVNAAVPAALEAVCLKAMALTPADRYPTPNELADELEHWLADEPVSAFRETFAARARRWMKRHRSYVAAAAASALVAVTALAVGTVLLAAANEQERKARRGEQAARGEAEGQRDRAVTAEKLARDRLAETEEQKRRADLEAQNAMAMLAFVQNKVLAAARPEGQEGGLGRDVTVRQALEAALPFVRPGFASQPVTEARLRMTLGGSFYYLGDFKLALEQHEIARELFAANRGPDHPDTLQSMNDLALCYDALGRHADALKLLDETLALQRAKLGPDHPDTLRSMHNLAGSYYALGRYSEALKLFQESFELRKVQLGPDHPDTLKSMGSMATTYWALGQYPEALKIDEQTLAVRKAHFGPGHPDTLRSMNALANDLAALGKYTDALKLQEETLALRKAHLGPDHPDTLASMNNLANSYAAVGRRADALKLHEEALALMKAKLGPDHPTTLMCMHSTAADLEHLNRGAEAIKLIDEVLQRSAGKVIDPRVVPGVMHLRLLHFAKLNDVAGCRATAEMWEKFHRTDVVGFYDSACYRATTAAVIALSDPTADGVKQSGVEAERAMAWLRQAIAAGYNDADQMANDAELYALRDRPDFKGLLTRLGNSKAKDKR